MQIVGFGLMFSVLSISGFTQGKMLEEGAHWIESVVAIRAFWVARTFGGTLMDVGLDDTVVSTLVGRLGKHAV